MTTAIRTGKNSWTVTIDGIAYHCPAVRSEADAIRTAQNAAQWRAFSAVAR